MKENKENSERTLVPARMEGAVPARSLSQETQRFRTSTKQAMASIAEALQRIMGMY